MSLVLALLGAQAMVAGQWLHYRLPTCRTADGTTNLAARAPRLDEPAHLGGALQLPAGLPDPGEIRAAVGDCDIEIGGSPLALNIGADQTELIDEMCLENGKSFQRMRGR